MRTRVAVLRGVAVLAVAALAAGALAITPGSAASFLTKAKAKKIFYTKKNADAKFLELAETDPRYLQQTKVVVVEDTVSPTSNQITDALCPAGHEALGGGYQFATQNVPPPAVWDEPLVNGDNLTAAGAGTFPATNGWRVNVDNTTGSSYTYAVGVICAPAA